MQLYHVPMLLQYSIWSHRFGFSGQIGFGKKHGGHVLEKNNTDKDGENKNHSLQFFLHVIVFFSGSKTFVVF